MKFTIASTALIATMASAAPQRNVKLSRNLRESSPVTKALLTRARPYSRELEGEDEVQFDGSYNLKFSQCVDIKIYDEDKHAAYVDSIAAGTVVPTKSYVIFHVCTDATCDYEGTDDLYIVDLATYLGTVATYHAEKTQKFCEACGEFEDICNPEDDEDAADQGDEEEEQEEDGGEEEEEDQADEEEEDGDAEKEEDRKLKRSSGHELGQTQRRTSRVAIDCDACQATNCYAEEAGEENQDLDKQAAEWIQKVSECVQAEAQYNGEVVYYGAMCDEYGDGVELAVFLDEECSIYTSEVAFNNVYMKEEGNDAYNYLTYAENYIKTAFSDVMSCDDPNYFNAEEEQEDADDDENEMNEYCKEILKQEALSYSSCEENENAEQLITDEGYAYDLVYDEDLDIEEVCAVVKGMENAGEYFNAYDSSTSGTWYMRDKKGQIIVESNGNANPGLSGGAIFGIIAAIAVVVSGTAFFMMKKDKKGDIAESAEYQGGALS